MSKSSSGSFISIPTIIFFIVMWNILFDDDDKDEKTIKVEDPAPIVSNDTSDKPSLDVKLKELGVKAKGLVEDSVTVVKEELKKEDDKLYETQNIEAEKEKVAEKEKKLETIKPLEEEKEKTSKGIGMKKL